MCNILRYTHTSVILYNILCYAFVIIFYHWNVWHGFIYNVSIIICIKCMLISNEGLYKAM